MDFESDHGNRLEFTYWRRLGGSWVRSGTRGRRISSRTAVARVEYISQTVAHRSVVSRGCSAAGTGCAHRIQFRIHRIGSDIGVCGRLVGIQVGYTRSVWNACTCCTGPVRIVIYIPIVVWMEGGSVGIVHAVTPALIRIPVIEVVPASAVSHFHAQVSVFIRLDSFVLVAHSLWRVIDIIRCLRFGEGSSAPGECKTTDQHQNEDVFHVFHF